MKESILISIIIIIIYIFILINRNNSTYIKSNTGTKFLIHKDNKKQEKANLLKNFHQKLKIVQQIPLHELLFSTYYQE